MRESCMAFDQGDRACQLAVRLVEMQRAVRISPAYEARRLAKLQFFFEVDEFAGKPTEVEYFDFAENDFRKVSLTAGRRDLLDGGLITLNGHSYSAAYFYIPSDLTEEMRLKIEAGYQLNDDIKNLLSLSRAYFPQQTLRTLLRILK